MDAYSVTIIYFLFQTSRIQPRRIEELKKHREYLKSELHLALDKFPSIEYNAQLAKLNLDITGI